MLKFILQYGRLSYICLRKVSPSANFNTHFAFSFCTFTLERYSKMLLISSFFLKTIASFSFCSVEIRCFKPNEMKTRKQFVTCIAAFAILFCSNLLIAQNYSDTKLTFLQNDLPAAKQLAAQSGKIILIKFGARWCQPCRIMDIHVWSDPELIQVFSEISIPLAVDVDNFDGMDIKEWYGVRSLPTILICKADGTVLFRNEGSMTATDLVDLIRQHGNTRLEVHSKHPAADPAQTVHSSIASLDIPQH